MMKRLNFHRIVICAAASSSTSSVRNFTADAGAASSGSTSPSFVNGLFKRTFNKREMFPYPRTKMDHPQQDRLTNVLNDLNATNNSKGVRAMSITVENGGQQLSHTARAAVMETIGEKRLTGDIYNALHTCTCAHLLSTFANADQKAAYLPKIANGEANFAFAFTEMDHEVDVSMCTTTANACSSNGAFTITGAKVMRGLTSAQTGKLTHILVLAKASTQAADADGNPVPSATSMPFIVSVADNAASGALKISGADVTFVNCPTLDMVGVMGEGFSYMMVSKHTMRYGHDAALIGTCKGIYGQLYSLEAPTEVLSYAAALIYGMESALYALTANMDNNSQDALIDAAFASIAVHYGSKRIATLLKDLANVSVKGTAPEVSAFMKQLEHLLVVGEPVDSLQSIAACCGVEDFGIEFQKEGTITTMGSRMARGLGSKQRLPLKAQWPEVAPIEDCFAAFGDAVEAVFTKAGPAMRHKQLSMARIANAGASIYTACAAVSRATLQDKKETGVSERALCKTLIPILMTEATAAIAEVNDSSKSADDGLVRVVGEMMAAYVPIDANSAELQAEDAIVAQRKKAEEAKKAAEEAAASKAEEENETKKE